MASVDTIPKALQYGVSNSQARVVRQKLQPLGVSSGSSGTSVRFLLPQKSIIDLRSLAVYYDYTINGLTTDANNFSNAQFPPTYQHWSSVKFFCSGASSAGSQCNHLDMVHHALVRASCGEDWANSRLNNAYDSLIANSGFSADPGATSKTLQATYDDFILFRSKNYCYDSSLFGNMEIELTFNDKNILKVTGGGSKVSSGANLATTYAEVNHAFSSIVLAVDTIVSISPLYVSLLAERLQVSSPIRLPFSEVRSVLASNTGSNRITLQSSCVDAVLVAFLNQDPNAGAATASVATRPNVNRYKFSIDSAQKDAMGFQLTIGSEVYPRQSVQKLAEILDGTTNAIYGNDAHSTNMLYLTISASAAAYTRDAPAAENAIALTKFAIGEEGWATGLLCGLQTNGVATDCVVNSNSAASSRVLIAVMQTSQIVFDPSTSAVSIEA
jgi:hypothetical protein